MGRGSNRRGPRGGPPAGVADASSTQTHRTYNVTATYPDMGRARPGVEALEEAGVDATAIFLAGRAVRAAATDTETADRDQRWLSYTWQRARGGVLRGLGFFVALVSGEKTSGAFEETFEEVEGAVVVGVHTDDRAAFETATAALTGRDPSSSPLRRRGQRPARG